MVLDHAAAAVRQRKSNVEEALPEVAEQPRASSSSRGRHQLPPGDACEAARRSIDEPARFVAAAVNEDLVLAEPGDRDVVTLPPVILDPDARLPVAIGVPGRYAERSEGILLDERARVPSTKDRLERALVEAVGALEARHRVPDERGERLIALEKEATVGIVLIMLTSAAVTAER